MFVDIRPSHPYVVLPPNFDPQKLYRSSLYEEASRFLLTGTETPGPVPA